MTQEPSFFTSIGKQVKDEYGRTLGRVTSFAVKPNGRVDSAYIEQGDGKLAEHPVENLKIEDSEIILLSPVKMKASSFGDQIPLIWRKNQALKGLLEKDKISPELYEDLHESFEGVLNQLKSEAQSLLEEIEKETARRAEDTKNLNYALVNLELEHEIGQIDDESYHGAFAVIQESLKMTNLEKSDLEAMKNKLSNILLGEIGPETEPLAEPYSQGEPEAQEEVPTSLPESPNLPEPPVVVYVKEAGESSA